MQLQETQKQGSVADKWAQQGFIVWVGNRGEYLLWCSVLTEGEKQREVGSSCCFGQK